NPNWPEPYIKINGNCSIIGTVIFSGKPRRYTIKA
ncbi:TPA: LexA family transcriptional regulator, partial [Escherichia coli]